MSALHLPTAAGNPLGPDTASCFGRKKAFKTLPAFGFPRATPFESWVYHASVSLIPVIGKRWGSKQPRSRFYLHALGSEVGVLLTYLVLWGKPRVGMNLCGPRGKRTVGRKRKTESGQLSERTDAKSLSPLHHAPVPQGPASEDTGSLKGPIFGHLGS